MKNKLVLLLIPIFALAGCDTIKVDDEGKQLNNFLSEYSIRVSSNSNNLYFSLDDGWNAGQSEEGKLYKPGLFKNSAHYDFNSFEDVGKPEFWYYQLSNEPNAEKFAITSFEDVDYSSTYYYLQKIEFDVKIEEEGTHQYDVSIEKIEFPKVNVYSLIFAGNAGYQERLSDGDKIAGDEIISHLTSNEVSRISFYMYLNGNDPLVTNEHLTYINENAKGLFDIRVKITENTTAQLA